ncbi:hypothetical protein ATK30_8209 [Amycolatopsis echigonensis]|uniref:Uncharacterized protein n=1 Tax=Amycolatopsis echigonensis TaxID=2576905 RepID=A0A2N3WTP0_9PSEU|nr:hypothetical protein [Amycolatopsis niigatensis]PKV97234.1 hypothetical protein ATK30_8209 [Amycolatopsis niigatensis]
MYLEYLKLNPEYEKTVALRHGCQPGRAGAGGDVAVPVDGGYTLC